MQALPLPAENRSINYKNCDCGSCQYLLGDIIRHIGFDRESSHTVSSTALGIEHVLNEFTKGRFAVVTIAIANPQGWFFDIYQASQINGRC